MKQNHLALALAILALASLACQMITGSGNAPNETPQAVQPTVAESNDNPTDTDFPVTSDAYNVTEAGGSLVFYTKLSLDETMQFYRDEYATRGYTERETLTVVSDGTFSMVFDGDPSGQAVVIQSVDLGDGSRTVAIRLEDV